MLSVIVPCFNHGHFLEETILSILSSTYSSMEIIIIDDGSTDTSREVGEELCKRYTQVSYYYQDNAGPSVARNHGVKQAIGKYILALDADDLISPIYIEEAVKILDSCPDVKVVYANAEKFGSVNKPWNLKQYTPRRLAVDNMIYVSAIYRKIDWERVGGYTEDKRLVREDWEFWIKMLKDGGEVVKLPIVGFYYRIHSHSRRKSMSKCSKDREIEYLNEYHADFFKKQLGGPLRKSRSWSRVINFFAKGSD